MVMLNNDIVAVCCDVGSIMDHPLETTKSHDVLQDLKDQNTAIAAPFCHLLLMYFMTVRSMAGHLLTLCLST